MTPSVILAALATVILWGGSPVGTKFAVAELSPLAVAAARTCIGGTIAAILAWSLRIPLPATASQRILLLTSSVGGFIGFPFLFTIGMSTTTAIHGAMILAFLPVTTGAIAHLWDRRWPERRWWLGCMIAVTGEMVLILGRSAAVAGHADLTGDLIIVLSTLFASMGYVAGGRLKQRDYPSQGTTYWGVTLASILLLPTLPFLYRGIDIKALSFPTWAALIYLAVGVTVVGYIGWYWALGRGGIENVGVLQFLQPVSGIVLAYFLLGEPLSAGLAVATALILGGIYVATRVAGRRR
ncbi:MAG: DMT family transporter [Proteobacteria bacterium]|nr:DMT family transporter [Pseudomonadota bacterium]